MYVACRTDEAKYLGSKFLTSAQGMPKNCSSDYSAIIDYVDMVFTQGSSDDKAERKYMGAILLVKLGN